MTKASQWKNAAGERVRIIEATDARVIILSLTTGERRWIDAADFRATFKPLELRRAS